MPPEKIAVVYDGVPVLEACPGTSVIAVANAGDPQKGAPLAVEAARLAGVPLELSGISNAICSTRAVMVYVTHSEGLGSGVLLAMSAGVPVIASNVGGLPEIIRHGENGMLVNNDARRNRRRHPRTARRPRRAPAASAWPDAARSSSGSPWTTWSAVPWKFTGRC